MVKISLKGHKNYTREEIEAKLGCLNLWEFYLGEPIKLYKKIISPVRSESDSLSAGFFGLPDGTVLLKDFKTGKIWNIWSFIKYKYSCDLNTALLRVLSDFKVSQYHFTEKVSVMASNEVLEGFKKRAGYCQIRVKRKRFSQKELNFWQEYHISKETLEFFNISALQTYWIIKDKDYLEYNRKPDELMFLISFGNARYKIYRPFSGKNKKWFTNVGQDVLQGMDQLEWVGETLILTKGIKELCILRELGLQTVALQGETSYPSEDIIKGLQRRFTNVYSLMDQDSIGLTAGLYFQKKYNILPIGFTGHKDLADYCKNEGLEGTKLMINKQIYGGN